MPQQDQVAEVKHHPDTLLLVLSLDEFLLCIGPSSPCIPGLTTRDEKKASLCCSHLGTKCPFLITEIQIQVLPQVLWLKSPYKFLVSLYFKLGRSWGRCYYYAVIAHVLHHTISSNHFPSHVCLGCTLIHLVPTMHSCQLTLGWGASSCQCHCCTVATTKARKERKSVQEKLYVNVGLEN